MHFKPHALDCLDRALDVSKQELCLLNLNILFFIQIEELQFVRDQLCFSGLSSEVQPLPSERAGAGQQQAAGFRSEAAL